MERGSDNRHSKVNARSIHREYKRQHKVSEYVSIIRKTVDLVIKARDR